MINCTCPEHIIKAVKGKLPVEHAVLLVSTIMHLDEAVKNNNEFIDGMMPLSKDSEVLCVATTALNLCQVLGLAKLVLSNKDYLLSFGDPVLNKLVLSTDKLVIETTQKIKKIEEQLEELRDGQSIHS